MSSAKAFFLPGRKVPDKEFRTGVAWRLRALELDADATFIEGLELDDAHLFSLFEISNAERKQERGAGFTPGSCQSEYLARLQEVDHDPNEALDGLIAAGIEDMRRAHATRLRRRQRRNQKHPKATRVRPITPSRRNAA